MYCITGCCFFERLPEVGIGCMLGCPKYVRPLGAETWRIYFALTPRGADTALHRPGTTLMVPLRGTARIPCLSIKPKLLQFGVVQMGTHSELPCRLGNDSDKLTLRYSITQTASFHCKPAHGALSNFMASVSETACYF